MKRSSIALSLTAVLFASAWCPALAASPDREIAPQVSAAAHDDVAEVLARARVEARGAAPSASSGGQQVVRRTVVVVRRVVLGCAGNEPTLANPLDVFCVQATQLCDAAGYPGRVLVWFFSGPPGVAAPTGLQWTRTGQACVLLTDIPALVAAPVVTGADFRRLPLPAGVTHIQPGSGRTLINVPTNVFVEARPVVIPTTVLGQSVRVRATAVGFRWSFGDGAALDTQDPGAAYPDLRTTHTYSAPGSVRIGLTTTYRGEYSVAEGPWIPIDGTAQVATAPAALTVVAARAELVDQPLP